MVLYRVRTDSGKVKKIEAKSKDAAANKFYASNHHSNTEDGIVGISTLKKKRVVKRRRRSPSIGFKIPSFRF
jgi:hypothetical protein